MFKLLAGVWLLSKATRLIRENDIENANNCFFIGIALIGAGLDTIIF